MKNVIMSNAFAFGTEPFPAFRCDLVYGRNKRDRVFLPVKGIEPVKNEGENFPTLPEGKFQVIKTKEKQTLLVVPGMDTTNRCLLFVGCVGGFRGGEEVLEDGTTATVLKTCSAGNACESSTEIIALLEVGQAVTFYTHGRRTSEVYQYTWDGIQVVKTHFSKEEWDTKNNILEDDAEIL